MESKKGAGEEDHRGDAQQDGEQEGSRGRRSERRCLERWRSKP
jgi:hypothetical protein